MKKNLKNTNRKLAKNEKQEYLFVKLKPSDYVNYGIEVIDEYNLLGVYICNNLYLVQHAQYKDARIKLLDVENEFYEIENSNKEVFNVLSTTKASINNKDYFIVVSKIKEIDNLNSVQIFTQNNKYINSVCITMPVLKDPKNVLEEKIVEKAIEYIYE